MLEIFNSIDKLNLISNVCKTYVCMIFPSYFYVSCSRKKEIELEQIMSNHLYFEIISWLFNQKKSWLDPDYEQNLIINLIISPATCEWCTVCTFSIMLRILSINLLDTGILCTLLVLQKSIIVEYKNSISFSENKVFLAENLFLGIDMG